MHDEIPKAVKRQMNALVETAHTLALKQALARLDADFDLWRRGEIGPFELNERIHKFHNGPAREIYNQFADRRNATLRGLTAYSIATGLIDEKDVSPEVMQEIAPALQFYREEEKRHA